MNIAIVGFYYPHLGGSARVARRLAKYLVKLGHTVRVIAYPESVEFKIDKEDNLHIHSARRVKIPVFRNVPYTITRASRIVNLCKKHDIDVIHVHYAIPHAISSFLAKQIVDVPLIVTLHGSDIHTHGLRPSIKPILTMCLEKADYLTSVSKYLKGIAKKDYRIKNKIDVVYNFINVKLFRKKNCNRLKARLKIPKDKKIILHASNFRPVKNTEMIVDAAPGIIKESPNALFLMVGEGPELGNIKKMVRKNKLQRYFRFIGRKGYMSKLFNIADVTVLTSIKESFGLVLAESMACETPVVATNVGGIPEVVKNGKTGLLVHLNRPKSLARAVVKLLKNDKLREKMGKEGRKYVIRNFGTMKIVKEYLKIYQRLAKKTKKKR